MSDDAIMPGPYRDTKFKDFIKELSWTDDCGAFILIGIGVDPDDKRNARLNIVNSEISHDMLTYLALALMYHHNLKTDTQEIVLISKDRDGA